MLGSLTCLSPALGKFGQILINVELKSERREPSFHTEKKKKNREDKGVKNTLVFLDAPIGHGSKAEFRRRPFHI